MTARVRCQGRTSAASCLPKLLARRGNADRGDAHAAPSASGELAARLRPVDARVQAVLAPAARRAFLAPRSCRFRAPRPDRPAGKPRGAGSTAVSLRARSAGRCGPKASRSAATMRASVSTSTAENGSSSTSRPGRSRRVGRDRARQTQALPLAAGDAHAELADLRVHAAGESGDVRVEGRDPHVRARRAPREPDAAAMRTFSRTEPGEEVRVLGQVADAGRLR